MAAIDVGVPAANRAYSITLSSTQGSLNADNPADGSGLLTTIEIWADTDLSDTRIGTFYGSSGNFTRRDIESIGSVTSGSKQTFTGKALSVVTGDLLGITGSGGKLDRDTTGFTGIYSRSASNPFDLEGSVAFGSLLADQGWSFYATGTTQAVNPTVTTQTATSVTSSGCTGNGTITDVGTSDVTRRGFCYKVGTSGDPTTADSVAYDDDTYGWGVFTKAISGLSAGTGYRVRAYAVNGSGTSYGDTVQITTESAGLNAGKLASITASSIAKVFGIAVASIKKIMGVAVQ
jgi:hypothetical protein